MRAWKYITACAGGFIVTQAATAQVSVEPIAGCPTINRTAFADTVLIAQQASPSEEEMGMYGNIGTQAFLVGGAHYNAGGVEPNQDDLNDFLGLSEAALRQRLSSYVEAKFDIPDRIQNVSTGLWSVPGFGGLVIMDIERDGHPDKLYAKYADPQAWSYVEGPSTLVGDALIDRIFEQYERCISATKLAFPNAKIGMYGTATANANGCVGDNFAKNMYLFKAKAYETGRLDMLDFLCPRVYPVSASTTQMTGCHPRANAAQRHEQMLKISLNALRYGPQVDTSQASSTQDDPYGLLSTGAVVEDDPDLWESNGWDPVVDSDGDPFLVCPLLSAQIFGDSENPGAYCIDADPGLAMTIKPLVDLLEPVVNATSPCMVRCYAYWIPGPSGFAFSKLRQTINCAYCEDHGRVGDYDDDGVVSLNDWNIFYAAWNNGNNTLLADIDGDGDADPDDYIMMANLYQGVCPACP